MYRVEFMFLFMRNKFQHTHFKRIMCKKNATRVKILIDRLFISLERHNLG